MRLRIPRTSPIHLLLLRRQSGDPDLLELVPVPDAAAAAVARCSPHNIDDTAASSAGTVVALSESSGLVEAAAFASASVKVAVGLAVVPASQPGPKSACSIAAWVDVPVEPPGVAEPASEASIMVEVAFAAFEAVGSASVVSVAAGFASVAFEVAGSASDALALAVGSAEGIVGRSQCSFDHQGRECLWSFVPRYPETQQARTDQEERCSVFLFDSPVAEVIASSDLEVAAAVVLASATPVYPIIGLALAGEGVGAAEGQPLP
ncbi:hypothetical protein BKA70DRAFT_1572806 [Coprinopsis sp. MPI-PUGE-AT-0042]|nr:hypothetical protein BKA70DRAFT_1572806 [Coprinopsis sp. MPI-PUGE-AT-0042]